METEAAVTAEAVQGTDGNVSDGVEESKSLLALVKQQQENLEEEEEMKVEDDWGNSPMFLLTHDRREQCLEFLRDQGRDYNFTDLDLICADGWIQVHRCVLMGASAFVRSLLIDKSPFETSSITLGHTSIDILRQVIGLLYTGKAIINAEDEEDVFKVIRMLGLPIGNFLIRFAKEDDKAAVTQLKHSITKEEDEDEERATEDGKSKSGTSATAEDDDESIERIMNKIVGKQGGVVGEGKKEVEPDDGIEEDEDRFTLADFLADSDALSLCEYIPLSEQAIVGNKVQRPHESQDSSKSSAIKDTSEDSFKMEIVEKGEESTSASVNKYEPSITVIPAFPSFLTASFEDMNFEEACNDLQKQVAMKPLQDVISNRSGSALSDRDKSIRKRKLSDDEQMSKIWEDGPPSRKTRSSEGSIASNKKKTSPEKRTTAKSDEKEDKPKSRNSSLDRKSNISSAAASQQYRRSSTCSGSTSGSTSTTTTTTTSSGGTSTSNSTNNRVFLEVKEFSGVKYNIYGLVDPVKGVQSGKTIAIIASKDKNKNIDTSSAKN